MNHQISKNEFFDVVEKHVDCYGAFSSDDMLKTLHTAGYTIVKNIPKRSQSTDVMLKYSPLGADPDNTIKLEGKTVADYSKNITISHGLTSMSISFTDGTRIRFSSQPTESDLGSKLVAVFIEPLKAA